MMKKLNKLFAVIISAMLLSVSFTACGNKKDPEIVLPEIVPGYTIGLTYTKGGAAVSGDVNKFINESFKLSCVFSGDINAKQIDKTTWKSSDTSVVSLNVTGGTGKTATVNAKKSGEAIVTATGYDGSVSASVKIIVSDFVISSSTTNIDFCLEESLEPIALNVTMPENRSVTYASSKTTVATVDKNGLVTPVGAGEANITVTEPKSKAKLTVPVVVTEKVVTPVTETIDLLYNSTTQEKYERPLFTAKYSGLTYSSSNLGVATVDVNGVVTAVGLGTAVITGSVTVNGKTYRGEVSVNVVSERLSEYTVLNDTDETYVNFYGRTYYDSGKKSVMFPYGAAGFEVKFYGTSLSANLSAIIHDGGDNGMYEPRLQVLVDGEKVPEDDLKAKIIHLKKAVDNEVTLISNLAEGVHTVKVLKRSAYARGATVMDEAGLKSFKTNDGGYIMSPDKKPELKIDLYGDSYSCAYGNLAQVYKKGGMTSENTNALLGYHYQAAQALNAQINIQAHSGWGIYVFTDGSIQTSYGQWYNRYQYLKYDTNKEWDFNRYQADVVIINLGANDQNGISKGNYKSADYIAHYKEMINGLAEKYGNSVHFVLCHSFEDWNQTVVNDIKTVATEADAAFKAAGKNVTVTAYEMHAYGSYGAGYQYRTGHPSLESHLKNGKELAEFIKTKFNY